MKKINKILKTHKDFTIWETFIETKSGIELEHMTEIGESEIIFTAAVKVNIKTKRGKKILLEMINKQSSPIKKELQNIERNNKKDLMDGKGCEYYSLPDEILKTLE